MHTLVTETDKEFDINAFDGVGNTPLHWAASSGNLQGLLQLIEWGAALDCKNYMGLTPREYALQRSSWKINEARNRAKRKAYMKQLGITAVVDDGAGADKISVVDVVRCIKTLDRAEQVGGMHGQQAYDWRRMRRHMAHARANGLQMAGFAQDVVHVPLPLSPLKREAKGQAKAEPSQSSNQEGGQQKKGMLVSASAPAGLRSGATNRQYGVNVRPLDEESRTVNRLRGEVGGKKKTLTNSRSYACNLEPLPLSKVEQEHMEGWATPLTLRGRANLYGDSVSSVNLSSGQSAWDDAEKK
jgi:hypothetical protein